MAAFLDHKPATKLAAFLLPPLLSRRRRATVAAALWHVAMGCRRRPSTRGRCANSPVSAVGRRSCVARGVLTGRALYAGRVSLARRRRGSDRGRGSWGGLRRGKRCWQGLRGCFRSAVARGEWKGLVTACEPRDVGCDGGSPFTTVNTAQLCPSGRQKKHFPRMFSVNGAHFIPFHSSSSLGN